MGTESITSELTRIIAAVLNTGMINPTDRYTVTSRPELKAVEVKCYCVLGKERDDLCSTYIYKTEYDAFFPAVGSPNYDEVLDRLIILLRNRIDGVKRHLVLKVMGARK